MRAFKTLVSPPALSVLAGLAGGLALGYLLGRNGAWLTPFPWAIYLVILLVLVAVVSWLAERQRAGERPVHAGASPANPIGVEQDGNKKVEEEPLDGTSAPAAE